MRKTNVTIILLTVSVLTQGCATNSRDKILQGMFVAGTLGALYGLSKTNDREANAAMYAGIGAASSGVIGLMLENPDTEVKRLREEVTYLKNQRALNDDAKLVAKTPATFTGSFPDNYKTMINPGSWSVMEIDQWVQDGENRLIHQDKIMELIPPSLVPRGK